MRDWDLAGWHAVNALIGWAGAEEPLPPLNLLMDLCGGEASRTSLRGVVEVEGD